MAVTKLFILKLMETFLLLIIDDPIQILTKVRSNSTCLVAGTIDHDNVTPDEIKLELAIYVSRLGVVLFLICLMVELK